MPLEYENICVVGLGYIGLPTASIMATRGFKVHGADVNQHAVDTINKGQIHIHEPALDALVKSAVGSGRLKAFLEPQPADVFILAVPTPFMGSKQPDLGYIESATRSIAPHVIAGNLIILESTSPVGATEHVADLLRELRPDLKIPKWSPFTSLYDSPIDHQVFLAHCPERVLPGKILQELVENDRIIGGINASSARVCEAVYRKFVNGKILLTDSRTAELCKLTENSFRDVNIAFANELSLICDKLNIDVWTLINLANHHPRVKILQPGPGVGGHCIAVDPWFIVSSAPEEARLIRTAREVNDYKPHWVVSKIKEQAERFKSPTIACLGLAFKANIDDLRESPAVDIALSLASKRIGTIVCAEPYIQNLPENLISLDNIELLDAEAAILRADIVVPLVNHDVFTHIDRNLLRNKIVVDTLGMWRH